MSEPLSDLPEADAAEQAAELDSTDPEETPPGGDRDRIDTEANEADAAEQSREAGQDDDDYR